MSYITDKINGLSNKEVEERIKKNLINGEEKVNTKSVRQIVLGNLITLFNVINIVLAIIVIYFGSVKNALFIGTVFANLAIGIYQELKAKRIIDKLKIMSLQNAHVIREGTECEIPISEIVIDDLLILKSGEQIGADCRILIGNCQVNESLVTGESYAIEKNEGDTLISGSFVVAGSISCQVIHVGDDNYVNKISNGAKYIKKPNSEILSTTRRLVRFATIFLLSIAYFLFKNQLSINGSNVDKAVINTIAAVVGMIPSGLILLITTVLASSVIRLSKFNTLVQEIYCIETLARCDVICLDKTGTITDGNMTVEDVYFLEEDVSEKIRRFVWAQNDVNTTLLAIRNKYPKKDSVNPLFIIPFSSDNKYSAAGFDDGSYYFGAPEFIFSEVPTSIKSIQEDYMEDGLRVLVLAHSASLNKAQKPEDLKPIALIALMDTLRSNARETISYFKKQQVKAYVISGDNPKTVASIAKEAGIDGSDRFIDMSNVEDKQIPDIAGEYSVYGRVTPAQKLLLIKALKSKGMTVAMTGDGVNDVLALKEADCSIAMQSGSSAARCASQIILLDSDFSSMPRIVGEGRRSINNIQRSSSLFLVKTVYACILGFIFAIISKTYPFEPIQLTLITTFFIGLPSLLLGFEPNYKKNSGEFFKSIMDIAIPSGVLVALNVLITILGADWIRTTQLEMSTMSLYTTGFCMALILIYNCMPFSRWRSIICISMPILFVISMIVMPKFFSLAKLNIWQLLLLLIWGVMDYLLYVLLVRFTTFINTHHFSISRRKS